jgi:hypothetical protein
VGESVVLEYLEPLRTAVQLIRDGLSLYRELKPTEGGAPDEVEQKLEEAEQQLRLAEVGAAQTLGYRICRKHWLPGIMIDESYRVDEGPLIAKWRCLDCGFTRQWSTASPPPPTW